ncbi:MAG: cytochrome c-type biogenesis protein CcmH [Polyangiales bacterium]
MSAAALTLIVMLPAGLLAQESTDVGSRSARLSQRVMSPFCPGKTLYHCPSSSATDMRLEMTGWMEQGLSEDDIVRRLEEQMPGFDFTPPAATSGLFWWVWVLATLFLVLAALRLVRRRPAGAADEESGDDDYERRLDEALQRELS